MTSAEIRQSFLDFFRAYASLQALKTAEAKPDLEKYIALAPPDGQNMAQAKDLLAKIK